MSSPMGTTKTIPLNPTHLVHHNYSFNCITSQKLQALSLCVQHIYVVGTGGCFFSDAAKERVGGQRHSINI